MDIRRTVSGKSLRHFLRACAGENPREKGFAVKTSYCAVGCDRRVRYCRFFRQFHQNVVPAELSVILDHAPIRTIYANGAKAYDLYQKYTYPVTGRDIRKLPSTSPANAAFQMERLLGAWQEILEKHDTDSVSEK